VKSINPRSTKKSRLSQPDSESTGLRLRERVRRYGSKEEFAAICFLLLVAAVYFLPVLTEGNAQVLSRVGTDTWGQFFYWRHFGYSAIAGGEIPLWNPYVFSGMPYIAGIQSAIFYPLNILYLLFDTPLAINLSIAVHCFLASLFTYFYARYVDAGRLGSILSAVTFAYGAPYFLHIYSGHLPHLSTMIWLPLLFLGIEAFVKKEQMKYAVLSGVVLSIQLFAGYPQYLFFSVVALTLYFLMNLIVRSERKRAPYLVCGFIVFLATGAALSAVQLLPAIELAKHSVREGLSYEWVSAFSFPPENLLTLLFPDFFGNMLTTPYWGKNYLWEMSLYLGVIPICMIATALIFGRAEQLWAFCLIALISLILALGKYTPLLIALYSYVPGFDRFRGLSKFAFVFAFAGSIIAGFGLKQISALAEEKGSKTLRFSYGLIAVSLLFLGLGVIGWFYGDELWEMMIKSAAKAEDRYGRLPPFTNDFFRASMSAAFAAVLKTSLILMVLAAVLFFAKVGRFSTKFLQISILALAVIDLWHFGSRYLVTFEPQSLYMDRELKAFLSNDREPFRIATPISDLSNVGLLEGIENVGGYDAIVLKHYSEFINLAQRLPVDEPNLSMRIVAASRLLDLLNVKYYVLGSEMRIGLPAFDLVLENDRHRVYRNNGALPRSFIVHDAWVIKNRDAIFRHMAGAEFDPGSRAALEETIDTLPYNSTLRSPVPRITQRSLNKVILEADLNEPGLLVLADAYYPGWKAFVDGKETKIYRTNYVMRGVLLAKGEHVIEFRYDPLSFKVGALISVISLSLVVGLLIRWSRSNR